MNPSQPQPVPTPFDIAEIPVFAKPFLYTPWPYIALAVLVIAAISFFVWKRSRKLSRPGIIRMVQRDLASTLERPLISKKEFALCWKKVVRSIEFLSPTAAFDRLRTSAETQLYGRSFLPDEAKKILQECHSLFKEQPWKE